MTSNTAPTVTHNSSIVDIIEDFDTMPKALAFRALANTCLAQAIRHAQNHVRRQHHNDTGVDGIDRYNEEKASKDEKEASKEQLRAAGIEVSDYDPLELAQYYWACYQYSYERCLVVQGKHDTPEPVGFLARQQARRDFDTPMKLDTMVDFMVQPNLSSQEAVAISAAAQYVDIDEETLRDMRLNARELEGRELDASRDDIRELLNSFTDQGFETCFEGLPIAETYRLTVKTIQKIWRRWWSLLNDAIRRSDLSKLGQLPDIKASADTLEAWLDQFSIAHEQTLDEAVIRGIALPALDDSNNPRPKERK